ncbi:Hsp33 family molecular chaperone HslO [Gracilibacillus timonensis]|uniref:Hsp33 family molecular chaperone HslO n=1 Tax=Gracilibacillus timonensis TaxID=1816696 RepID=UPI0008249665|nr:Hsp33 family molecular chaperone HslO [Gracilibacillus timonensis]
MSTSIIKTLIFDKQVRLYLTNNTGLLNEIIPIHQEANHVIKATLANSLSVVSLLSATLKEKQRLSTTLLMSQPKNKMHIDVDAQGNLRGYANDHLLAQEPASVKQLIGQKGSIRMIKSSNMNQFTGITDMPYQDIDKDFSHYFQQSEQTDTLFKTHIDWTKKNAIANSYGLYAQLLPQASKELLMYVGEAFDMLTSVLSKLSNVTETELAATLRKYFGESSIIGYDEVQFFCDCSKEMFFGLLHAMNKGEIENQIQSGQPMPASCNICGKTYLFTTEELRTYLQEDVNG